MKRTVLLGKGSLAIAAAAWLRETDGYDLAFIVPVIPEPSWTSSLMSWADANGVPTIDSGDYRDLLKSSDVHPIDLAISIFYDRIIDSKFISRCGRIVNLHNSPLPKYRGVSPINWALKNEERMHGVTIHDITPGIDDGPIIGQVLFSIYPAIDEVKDVYDRALRYGRVLLETTIPLIDKIQPLAQDESLASYYSHADDEALGIRKGFRRQSEEP